jgi:hypothetical protein
MRWRREEKDFLFAFYSPYLLQSFYMARWCTVCVVTADGRLHSLDIQADSTYDAAHIYVSRAKTEAASTDVSAVADSQAHYYV